MLHAEYKGKGGDVAASSRLEELSFDAKCLEELGFRPKSRVFRSATPEDKAAVRKAVIDLRKGVTQMPIGTPNLAYYLSHYILGDRFTPSESIYVLSRVVADQKGSLSQAMGDEVQVLLNEHEEDEPVHPPMELDAAIAGETDYYYSDMSPEDVALAQSLMQMFDVE